MIQLGEFESRELSPEERLDLFWEHGIVNQEVLTSLGFPQHPRRGTKLVPAAARALYLAGWPLPAIEDWLELSEDGAETLVAPVRRGAIRLLYLASIHTSEIAERLEVTSVAISKATVDIARKPRTGAGRTPETRRRSNALPQRVADEIRKRWLEGTCPPTIMRELGVSRSAVNMRTRGILRGPHATCDLCRVGPKRRALPQAVEDEIRRRWIEGTCVSTLARGLGLSRRTVYRYTRGLPAGPHAKCSFFLQARYRLDPTTGTKLLSAALRRALEAAPPEERDAVFGAMHKASSGEVTQTSLQLYADTEVPEALHEAYFKGVPVHLKTKKFYVEAPTIKANLGRRVIVTKEGIVVSAPVDVVGTDALSVKSKANGARYVSVHSSIKEERIKRERSKPKAPQKADGAARPKESAKQGPRTEAN